MCSCGDSIAVYNNVSDTTCNLPCYGNSLYNLEYCGGLGYESVYLTGKNDLFCSNSIVIPRQHNIFLCKLILMILKKYYSGVSVFVP